MNATEKQEDSHASEQTIPVNGDSNSTINTVKNFYVRLPIDEQFMWITMWNITSYVKCYNSLLRVISIGIKKIL